MGRIPPDLPAEAVFLGKTETTPFANNDPTITRNPLEPRTHARRIEQRLLRPAAYNGIVGFKATYGGVSSEGVIPNSRSLDHVGVHTRSIAGHEYVEYQRHRILFQREMCDRMAGVDAIFMPIALTTEPRGLSTTGSSIFNRPWTVSGFPAMSLPTGLDRNGLPFGMQVAAQSYGEERLLDVAA
ncbi:MAG: amidase family protein [Pseudomonadota bacterium]|nr:hypothetical protein [Pseudomonadota bacterium]